MQTSTPFYGNVRGSPPHRCDAKRDLKKKNEIVGQTNIRNNGCISLNPGGKGIMFSDEDHD
jgi:hypothetical protein